MNRSTVLGRSSGRTLVRIGAAALALGFAWTEAPALEQGSSATGEEPGVRLEITARDRDAARQVTTRSIHTAGTGAFEGVRNPPRSFKADQAGNLVELSQRSAGIRLPGGPLPQFTGPGFYPDDLSMLVPGSPVVTDAQIHNVFVNCGVDCFNRPGVFLRAFVASTFIHVLDQYTGTTQSGRYSVGGAAYPQYNIRGSQLNDATDITAIVYSAASTLGTGYNNIYNVFVPPGIDVCVTTTTGPECFSPNNPANWVFCAYHSAVDFSDIGHVLYTVIPYPDQALVANGLPNYVCDVGQTTPNSDTTPTPNGVVADSIASFLDHEISETITDPDGDAYMTQNSLADYQSEIGDVCVNPFYLYTPFQVSGTLYYIQPEYSNTYHACVTVP